ncbi:MAG: hypothetical protein IT305_26450 [Chloroflexi bacterium]|nr:hypothetical protein [Chloroflexota bacterium]
MLTSGEARGDYALRFRLENPSGLHSDLLTQSVRFAGEDHGVNFVAEFPIQFQATGLYWFDILLDDIRLTRVPYRVEYIRTVLGGQSPFPAPGA